MTALTDPWAPRGRVSTIGLVTSTTTGIIGTDVTTVITGAAFTAVAGRLYVAMLNVPISASVAGGADEILELNLRDGGGSNPTTGSALKTTWRQVMPSDTRIIRHSFVFALDGLSSGAHTLGVTVNRLNGTGTYTIGSATGGLESTLNVFDFGLAA